MAKDKEKSKFVRLERELSAEISNFLFALGNKFADSKNAEAAFDCFKYSLDLNDKNQPAVHNLGSLYNLTGNHDGAYRMFKESLRMMPNNCMSKVALAEVARKVGKYDEALQLVEEVIGKEPDNYLAMSAMAILYYDQGKLAEALDWNSRALEKKPGDSSMLLNEALIHMVYGRWEEYWPQYEYCLSYNVRNLRTRGLRIQDSWDGSEHPGKGLVVISDQGSGDAIQFSRYLGEAKALGKFEKLSYLVQPDLVELMSGLEGVDEVVGFGTRDSVAWDYFSSLLGIMRVLKVSPDNCWREPHLRTDPLLDRVWSARIGPTSGEGILKVGICWAGDPKHGNDHARSLSLQKLSPVIASGLPIKLYSFQVGGAAQQLKSMVLPEFAEIVDLAEDFRNWADTASAVKQMDLVISCDTAVAHLAGCLGVESWVLLPLVPEWRHLLQGTGSPWYSNTRLFRQAKLKDWGPTVMAVVDALAEKVGARKTVLLSETTA